MTDVESAFRMDTGFRAPDEDMDSEYGEPTFGLRPLPGAAALQTAANVADVAQYTTRALPLAAGVAPPPPPGARPPPPPAAAAGRDLPQARRDPRPRDAQERQRVRRAGPERHARARV